MSRERRASIVAVACVATVAFVGCNVILDNERGNLVTVEAGAGDEPLDPPLPSDEGDAGTPVDEDAGEAPPDPSCPSGQRMCFGVCVSMTDPAYGCGDPSCAPCPSNHGTASCQGRTCAMSTCDKGYFDCNKKANDGCEVDLSKPASCGACNAVCGAENPLCAPVGGSFQCTNGCTPMAPLACGSECVDPKTSVNHCGGCTTACPPVDNATVACVNSACDFTCKPAFHACAGKCVPKSDPATCGLACTPCPAPIGGAATCVNDTCGGTCPAGTHLCGARCAPNDDVTACGAACTACPVPPNATAAACTANACTFTCAPGFSDCDVNPNNGCEVDLATSADHCGNCRTRCKKDEVCTGGTCAPVPPDPAPIP